MKEELEKAIKANAEKAAQTNATPEEALKFSQAALNAAHALVTIFGIKKS